MSVGKSGDERVKSRGFNCDCTSLVVDLPFLLETGKTVSISVTHVMAPDHCHLVSPLLELNYSRDGRGPPTT